MPSPTRIPSERPKVVILRGHQPNPWELRPWERPEIAERYDVSYLRSRRGWFDTSSLALAAHPVWTLRDLLPPGCLGDLAVRVPGDRYLTLKRALRGADIVHTQELGYWYSMQAAQLKERLGFRLVTTVWETIPFLDAYRNLRTRPYRSRTLAATDLFLAATKRAGSSLLLEGAAPERIRICPPGVDADRFAASAAAPARRDPPLILSPGRLVWEKGHQDVLRALSLLRHSAGSQAPFQARLLIVGRGPEQARLRAYAEQLGLADAVEFRGFVPYEEMPAIYASATCVVLASLPVWSWEEQFGMVLAEAMAAGTPILASSSGAILEVADGYARYFTPGDWVSLAEMIRGAASAEPSPCRNATSRFSTAAAAERIASCYAEVLGPS